MAVPPEHPPTDSPEAAPPEQAPDAPASEAPVRACATCSAPLASGQDWCLECGSAQPGRLGGRPGWRAALTVLAVTGVLVGGAGAAAYAALSTDAQRDASAAAPPTAAPLIAAPPVVTAAPAAPPVTTPTTETTPTVTAPKSDAPSVPAPGGTDTPAPATPAPVTPPAPATPPATSNDDAAGGTDTTTETTPAEPVALDLPADGAQLYDPFGRAKTVAGDPADAVDGKADTAFELPVAADGTVRAGLTVSLEKAALLSTLVVTADTPGFTVEIYATKQPEIPKDVLDARWEHVANQRDSGVEEKFKLDGKYRHVLLWFTEQPADTKVKIPEVQLFD